jgi:hypothetical protein
MPLTASLAAESELGTVSRFVHTAENGHLFALPEFLAYHPPEKFATRHALVRKGTELCAVLPFAPQDSGKVWHSHPGASFGGPVFSSLGHFELLLECLEKLEGLARKEGARTLILQPLPGFLQTTPSDTLAGALGVAGYAAELRDITQAVALPASEEELRGLYDSARRNNLRKAEKQPFQVSWHTLDQEGILADFYSVLLESCRKHGSRPTHNLEDLKVLGRTFNERIRLIAAFLEGKGVAYSLVFTVNQKSWLTFYICQNFKYQESRPQDLVLHALLEAARREGAASVDFGTSTLGREKPLMNLFRYKEEFGARCYRREKFCKQL